MERGRGGGEGEEGEAVVGEEDGQRDGVAEGEGGEGIVRVEVVDCVGYFLVF